MYDASSSDRTHRVFHWEDLLDGKENRAEHIGAFTRILKRQKFVRIVLPGVSHFCVCPTSNSRTFLTHFFQKHLDSTGSF